MGKKKAKKRPPVPTEHDGRAREREGERTGGEKAPAKAQAPDGVSGSWS